MKIAVPSDAPGGMEAGLSAHFGHCDVFTLVEMDGSEVRAVDVLVNGGHEQGACLAPVNVLREAGADAMVAGGMGMRPLAGFQQAGIEVYFSEDAQTVGDAIRLVGAGQARRFGPAQACGGGGGGCQGH